MKKQILENENSAEQLKIVAIGGGHGLSALLRGIKKYSNQITAVVTVADNGGSSGALRRDMGVLPPGDIRSCLCALSPDEELLGQVLQYRFSTSSGVGGHNLGNLLLTALTSITGSFEQGIQELARILAIRGRVLPSTLQDVNLEAEVEFEESGTKEVQTIFGESEISDRGGKVRKMWIIPEDVMANPEAQHDILAADLIVLGPGSLYTSILPNLKVKGISQAIKASKAPIFYICNLTSQPGETDGFNCSEHVEIMKEAIDGKEIDGIICNNYQELNLPKNVTWVKINSEFCIEYNVYQDNLVDINHPTRHDSDKLAKLLMNSYSAFTSTK